MSFKPGDVIVWDENNLNSKFWNELPEDLKLKYYSWTGYPNKKRIFVFLTEIRDADGFADHCVLIALDNQSIETMRHPSEFRLATDEEF